MPAANPLLVPSRLPNQAPPFNKIKDSHYMPALRAAIKEARRNIAAIKKNKAAPDFENTIVALETASQTMGYVLSVFYNMNGVIKTPRLHALSQEIGPLSSDFSSDIAQDKDLFARVKAVWDKRKKLKLTPEQQTLLEDSYKSFVRSGALLSAAKQKRLRAINKRLSVLGPVFANNVSLSSREFVLHVKNEKDLAGLPENARAGARMTAQERGLKTGWAFTLDYPSFGPFLQYADNRALREKIWRAFSTRASKGKHDNSKVLLEIVRLRHERARLLGYKSHAAYVLEERMARTPENVMRFLEDFKKAYRPAAQKDLRELKAFVKTVGGPTDLKPWDISYYSEKLRQRDYAFSSEDLRAYFPLETVLKGCFDHFSKLFNLRFRENRKYPVWHKDVTAYDVFDKDSRRFMGTLYADFFPRAGGKNPGAWMTTFRDQGLYRGKVERPLVAIVCNFTKPTKGKPSLLDHDEVLTLFHEMGHAMHGMLSDVTYPSLSGTNVKWDFVELPSQVQENWAYTRPTLNLIGRHYKTGKPIPAALIMKLNHARNFMNGWAGLRQTAFGLLDMAWHNAAPQGVRDVGKFEDKIMKNVTLFRRMGGPQSNAFSHIFAGGYAAGYYSYKWAEVLDADAFAAFEKKGLYDRGTARAYRTGVLARGGSEAPHILYRRFRGRDADLKALLRREGLPARRRAA